MTTPASPSYAGYRFPAEIISHAVWLYFRFPLSLRMVEEMLAARGIVVSRSLFNGCLRRLFPRHHNWRSAHLIAFACDDDRRCRCFAAGQISVQPTAEIGVAQIGPQ
jgi:hypothetical protein